MIRGRIHADCAWGPVPCGREPIEMRLRMIGMAGFVIAVIERLVLIHVPSPLPKVQTAAA